ncbi:uncharacterized protein ACA1_168470 [Acanthamoeba castellanii str. Neff]|uniref:Uncharacterized protein n=1 Tax=Acanthamoeba castellanii (strain ATCC 30010 / Neff) TaxID=1257118 RepID=L8GH83_ACACF|nr:uncharacterized protein ACA1_168470 [Acanthamoeba castellanii str. Neff]ELR12455.1 hypothetical protein ACA1_168470 [Acanthamoeba castellanii str. Neff]
MLSIQLLTCLSCCYLYNFEIDSEQDWEVWPQAKKSTARLNLLLYIAWWYLEKAVCYLLVM